jgi:hypothetical protein
MGLAITTAPLARALAEDPEAGEFIREELQGLNEVRIARLLGITVSGDELPDAEAERLGEACIEEGDPYEREITVWLALFEAARLSVKHGVAIRFE